VEQTEIDIALAVVACSERYGYRCKSGVCVRTGSWCDGVVDCPDASDEIQQNCRQQGTDRVFPQ